MRRRYKQINDAFRCSTYSSSPPSTSRSSPGSDEATSERQVRQVRTLTALTMCGSITATGDGRGSTGDLLLFY